MNSSTYSNSDFLLIIIKISFIIYRLITLGCVFINDNLKLFPLNIVYTLFIAK